MGIYLLIYDRAGYGESDPNPKRSVKSEASDIEELADQLQLGSKYYVIGVSLGCYPAWSCIKCIPQKYSKTHFRNFSIFLAFLVNFLGLKNMLLQACRSGFNSPVYQLQMALATS